MRKIFSKELGVSFVWGLISSMLLKIESYWSLALLVINKEFKLNIMNSFIIIFQLVVVVAFFTIVYALYKRTNRKINYLKHIVFIRTRPEHAPREFDSKYFEFHTNPGSLDEKKFKEWQRNFALRELDFERTVIVNTFNETEKKTMTKDQIEKEITELYNEPFRYFK